MLMSSIPTHMFMPCRINPLLLATKNYSVADVDGEIIGFGQVRALRGGAMELCDVFVEEKNRQAWPRLGGQAWDTLSLPIGNAGAGASGGGGGGRDPRPPPSADARPPGG